MKAIAIRKNTLDEIAPEVSRKLLGRGLLPRALVNPIRKESAVKAIELTEDNITEIIRNGYGLPRDELRTILTEARDFNETYYFVPQYIPKHESQPVLWAFALKCYLEEQFNFDLPEQKTDWFEITRK